MKSAENLLEIFEICQKTRSLNIIHTHTIQNWNNVQKLHQRNWISYFQNTHTYTYIKIQRVSSSNFAKVLCKFAKITNAICSAASGKTKEKKL